MFKHRPASWTPAAIVLCLATWACSGHSSVPSPPSVSTAASASAPQALAQRLAQEWILVDTHVDVPYRLEETPEDISARTQKGDFDYPRARQGGLDAPFMSIYIPARLQKEAGASRKKADELIDRVEAIAAKHPDKFAIARSPSEVRAVAAAGKIALPMGIENASAFEEDLSLVRHFYDRGVRYATLTHGENNHLGDSSYAKQRQWHGLSPFGRDVVGEMNRLGMMVDISHVSDETFDAVLAIAQAPLIASHSSCREYTPGFERNLDDERIRKLAAKGGVYHVNFGSSFLRDDIRQAWEPFYDAHGAWSEKLGHKATDEEDKAFFTAFFKGKPPGHAELADVVKHIRHVIDIAGIEHVGLGSDFDGVGDSLPDGLRDVSQYPNLIAALLDSGLSQEDVRKICGENTLRVWGEIEATARRLQTAR
jgi:membrane dipeptidase